MLVAINLNENDAPIVRIAILQERLGALIESAKASETSAGNFRNDIASSIKDITKEMSALHLSHDKVSDKLSNLDDEIKILQEQLKSKMGIVYFQGIWKFILGIGVLITGMGGLLTIARTLHWIP